MHNFSAELCMNYTVHSWISFLHNFSGNSCKVDFLEFMEDKDFQEFMEDKDFQEFMEDKDF